MIAAWIILGLSWMSSFIALAQDHIGKTTVNPGAETIFLQKFFVINSVFLKEYFLSCIVIPCSP